MRIIYCCHYYQYKFTKNKKDGYSKFSRFLLYCFQNSMFTFVYIYFFLIVGGSSMAHSLSWSRTGSSNHGRRGTLYARLWTPDPPSSLSSAQTTSTTSTSTSNKSTLQPPNSQNH